MPGPRNLTDESGGSVDAASLARDLARSVRGEVRFDTGSRALYATDGSNYRQPPIGVVIPRDTEDVEAAIAVCRRHDAPVFGRGGGTSLAGQCCNAAVCFDFSKYMNRVLDIDKGRQLGRVQPGAILDHLRDRAESFRLTFGPDPATHTHCTLGGMVGNDSCGIHSVMAQFGGTGARTSENVEELEILTYDGVRMRVGPTSTEEFARIVREGGRRGEIYTKLKALRDKYEHAIRTRFPRLPRRVSGYNLPFLLPEAGFNVARALVGTEGTCVMVTEVVANLIHNPAARTLLVLGYPDVYQAGDDVTEILEFRPIGLEGMDDLLVADMRKARLHVEYLSRLPQGAGWLLAEFGGASKDEANDRARSVMAALSRRAHPPAMRLFDDQREAEHIWAIRESGLGATAHVSEASVTWPGWEDSAVPPARVGEYLRSLRALLDKHGYRCDLYGHFGQGCIHTRIDFDFETADGIRRYRSFIEEAADLVVSLGGSLSGEHGDGQARGEMLSKMFGPELINAFREFKAIWDPRGRMNPGKVVDAYRIDEHLRMGASLRPVPTHFQLPEDGGSFAKATLRCVGVGECRRLDSGTMCPSFMVTREEMHSTRGRARLLFEMLNGDPLTGGWQDEHVKEALDLCLSCKGCKRDCPVNVDMATYKSEFLSHYFEGHWRPVAAYAFGLIHYWSRVASHFPHLINFITQTPGLSRIAKFASGMAPERQIPRFAPFTFKRWFAGRQAQAHADRSRIILWPDTFNNHFHPQTAIAAVQVLERAGFQVDVPQAPLCCGRPLYDYGMLDLAKSWLRNIMETLSAEIESGVPIVCLEPSCAAVFRDELVQLFPNDERAKRLANQTYLLSEFLNGQEFSYPPLHRKAVVHGHCHHRAVMTLAEEERALQHLGLDFQVLDSGCCGMAGSFGFESDHYDVSMKAGERVLLPAVRSAPRDTLIIADGFSCRTQIAEATGRRALHLADVLDMAAREGPDGPDADYPERGYVPEYPRPVFWSGTTAILAAGALSVALAGFFLSRRYQLHAADPDMRAIRS